MTIVDSLQGVSRLFLDSTPVIYYVERNPQYWESVREVFDRIRDGSLMAVTSPVTLAECLVRPYSLGETQLQQDFLNTIVNGNNVMLVPINLKMAQQAAQIRARYNLQLPDAFQVAVALAVGCEALLTNDSTFRRVTDLRVLVLDELNVS